MILLFLFSCQKSELKLESAETLNLIENRSICNAGASDGCEETFEEELIWLGENEECGFIVTYKVVYCENTGFGTPRLNISNVNINFNNLQGCSKLLMDLNSQVPNTGMGWTNFLNDYHAVKYAISRLIEQKEIEKRQSQFGPGAILTVSWIETKCIKYCASLSTAEPDIVPGWVESVCAKDACCFRNSAYKKIDGVFVNIGTTITAGTFCVTPQTGVCDNILNSSPCQAACSGL